MQIEKKLGEVLRKIREDDLKVTQKELAERLDITTVYVSYLEMGRKIPSKELLASLYNLAGYSEVPPKVYEMLREVKLKKKKENIPYPPTDIIYSLEEKNVYNYSKLKRLLKRNPSDLILIYGLLRLLTEEGKVKEAKAHLLKSLINIEKSDDKKWLESTYYELEGNYPLSIELMKEAINEFDRKNPKLTAEKKRFKSRLLFNFSSLYFKYGQSLFNEGRKEEAIEKFNKSLECYEDLRNVHLEPYYQMDYAGIFLWLALLGINPQENWHKYINNAKEALSLNYYQKMSDPNSKKGFYSKQYIISTLSFLARSYAQAALLEKNADKKRDLVEQGEFIFVQHTPIDLNPRYEEYYKYYFNQACFYSLKASVQSSLKEDYQKSLDLCSVSLQETMYAESKNKRETLNKEIETTDALAFFRKERGEDISKLIKKVKKEEIYV